MDRVKISGPSTAHVRVGDSGGKVTLHFCPTCGTSVHWSIDTVPGFVSIAVGAFADPDFPPPTVSVYDERRPAWAAMPSLAVDQE